MPKKKLREKSLVGWVDKYWEDLFSKRELDASFGNVSFPAFWTNQKECGSYRTPVKVRITITELGGK